jgi:hypothetical protein
VALQSVVVQSTNENLPWHICAEDKLPGSLVDSHARIACTWDGGQTWQRRPVIEMVLHCPACMRGRPMDYLSSVQIAAIAPNGSLLGTLNDRPDTEGATDLFGLYRLPLGDTSWQPMGRLYFTFGAQRLCLARDSTLWDISSDDLVAASANCSGDVSQVFSAMYR